MSFIVCETPNAISIHAREVDGHPVNLNGNPHQRRTLCDMPVGWDLNPENWSLADVRCRFCKEGLEKAQR